MAFVPLIVVGALAVGLAVVAIVLALQNSKLKAQTEAATDRAKAVTPDLISALQSFSDKDLMQKMASSMAPLSILGGTSVVDVLKKLLDGTPLAEHLASLGVKKPAGKLQLM